jgi:hypothetical protein
MVAWINATFMSVVAVVGAWRPSIHLIPSGLFCISRIPDAVNDKNRETTFVWVIDIDDLSKSIRQTHNQRTYVDCCIFKLPPPPGSRTVSLSFDAIVYARHQITGRRQRPTHNLWTNADCCILIFPPFPSLFVGCWMPLFLNDLHFCSTSLFPFDVIVRRD